MSDIRGKYGLIVQNVKSTFFDEVYREQGLVSVLTRKSEQFNEEKRNLLNQLFLKQNGDIEKILGLLEELETSIEELVKTGEAIKEVYNDFSSSSEEKQIDSNDAVGEINGNIESEKELSEEPVVEATKAESTAQNDNTSADTPVVIPSVESTSPSDVASAEEVKSEETTSADTPVVIPNVESTSPSDVVSSEEVKSEETTSSDTPVVIPSVESTSPSDVVSAEEVKSEETTSADTPIVIPNVESTDSTSAEEVKSEGEKAPESVADETFSLTPIVGVNTDNPLNVNEENNNEIMKFIRSSNALVKAILVTKVQYDKLVASLEKQKFILEKNVLASDNDIKNKMEDLLNQANVLYQEGKTAEAQDLYNQVSEMNKALQGSVGA